MHGCRIIPGAFCGRFFRTCWFGIFSQAVEFQLQGMRRAGNTRVIIADGLLALPGERRVGQVQTLRHIAPEIVFDGLLVLRRRWNDLGVEDHAAVIEAIAVVQDATQRLGAAVTGAGAAAPRWLAGRASHRHR